MKLIVTLAALLACASTARAQIEWPRGKTAAVVLTYDDALRSHLDVAIPQLAAAGFEGTFFLDGDLTPDEVVRWRSVARAGHELGNHSMFHPCPRALLPDRVQYLTENYDTKRMLDEIAAMNLVLLGIDGRRTRTYSIPCSQTLVGDTDYTDALRGAGLVRFARTGGDAYNSVVTDFAALDLFRVPSYGPVDQPEGARLIAYVERVRAARGLGVIQLHGVGGDYLQVSSEAHQQLVDHLRKHREIWVATFQDTMDYVAAQSR
jgi:peptidoglycan-N-acetylglucosamine deacetylase